MTVCVCVHIICVCACICVTGFSQCDQEDLESKLRYVVDSLLIPTTATTDTTTTVTATGDYHHPHWLGLESLYIQVSSG